MPSQFMTVRIIALCLSLSVVLSPKASAQLFLEDAKKVLAVSGGQTVTGTLLVHNTATSPVDIRVYWEDFDYRAPYDGTKNFFPAGTGPESASQWVTFSPPVFTMPALGLQKIDYAVRVPASIQEGHYGVLFFEKSTSGQFSGGGLTIVQRVGCLFFIEPREKSKKSLLQNAVVQGDTVDIDFVNQGNVVLIPHTTYYMMQDGGMVVLRGDAKKSYVPPGATAKIEIPIKEKLNDGHYTLFVNSDLDEGDVTVKELSMAVDASGQMTIADSNSQP